MNPVRNVVQKNNNFFTGIIKKSISMKNSSKISNGVKKIFGVIVFSLLLLVIFSPIALAGEAEKVDSKTGTEVKTETGTEAENASGDGAQQSGSTFGLEEVQGTPKGLTIPGILATIANMLISMAGFFLVVMLIYGGIVYLTSAGNEKRVETGKNVITYAIIGIVIIFAAYLVAQFVIQAVVQ